LNEARQNPPPECARTPDIAAEGAIRPQLASDRPLPPSWAPQHGDHDFRHQERPSIPEEEEYDESYEYEEEEEEGEEEEEHEMPGDDIFHNTAEEDLPEAPGEEEEANETNDQDEGHDDGGRLGEQEAVDDPANSIADCPMIVEVELPPFREDTPPDVQQKLLELNGMNISGASFSLNAEVRERSRIALEGRELFFHVSLFHPFHTGPSRATQEFRCPHQGCPARISWSIRDSRLIPMDCKFMHDHPIQKTSTRALNSLSNADRDHIRELVAQGKSSRDIHNEMDIVIAPATLQEILRAVNARRSPAAEAEQLRRVTDDWTLFKTRIVTDPKNDFGGFYAVNPQFRGDVTCTRTLIMDDTACTNHFELPLFVVLGIDEHGQNQLVGFAYLMERTADQFAEYLGWLRTELTVEGSPEPFCPIAVVVDRHEGQLKAIRDIFPATHVVFCTKHLRANIRDTFRRGPILTKYNSLVYSGITTDEWLEFLHAQLARRLTPKQRTLIAWLIEHVECYAPQFTFEWTGEQVSARVEGFFGILKIRIDHQKWTLAELASTLLKLAAEALRKRLIPLKKCFCQTDILARCDQARIGRKAATFIQGEVKKLREGKGQIRCPPREILGHHCCTGASRWKLPCVHFLLLRAASNPRLALTDFPREVVLTDLTVQLPVTHEVFHEGPNLTVSVPHWTYPAVVDFLGKLINSAVAGDPDSQRIVVAAHREHYEIHRDDQPSEFIRDPPLHRRRRGRQDCHPRNRSRLDPRNRIRPAAPEPARLAPPGRRCSNCRESGHDIRHCHYPIRTPQTRSRRSSARGSG
jgi:hypothetical protein